MKGDNKKSKENKELMNSIKQAQKDPQFMKEVRKFIRITTS